MDNQIYLIDKETLSGIADAIRKKNGTDAKISTEEFASEIEKISDVPELWETQGVSKSGNTVSLIDISPIEHKFKVSVSNGATVTKYSKNLINQSKFETKTSGGITVEYLADEDCFLINGTSSGANIHSLQHNIPTQRGERYTGSVKYISGEIVKSNGGNAIVYFGKSDIPDGNGNWFSVGLDTVDNTNKSNFSTPGGIAQNYFSRFWFYIYGGTVTFNNYKCRIQLELGSKATEYKSYETPVEYSPDGDGFVNIPYTYSSATLHSEGNITAEYIKSALNTSDEASMSLLERRGSHLDIPVGTIKIADSALRSYISLTSVNIPDTVRTIASYAFNYCQELTSVSMPNNLNEIGNNVFEYCGKCLTYDFSRSERIPTLGTNAFRSINANAKIIVPDRLYADWKTATNWTSYEDKIKASSYFSVNGQQVKMYYSSDWQGNMYHQTWQEWIDSDWNTVGAYVNDGVVYLDGKPLYWNRGGYTEEYADDVLTLANHEISDGASYHHYPNYVSFKLCGKWTYGLTGSHLGEWIDSVFNNLGAYIETDAGVNGNYFVKLPDGTSGDVYSTREEITDIMMYEGAIYW